MEKVSLNGRWTLTSCGGETLEASVPGSVYADYLNAGKMKDPFWRDNEMAALAMMDKDYCYTRTFTAPAALLACPVILLRCDGIDTLAQIKVNGKEIGRCDNMHRIWEFNLCGAITEGENTIEVTLFSPTKYIRKSYDENRADGSEDAMVGFPNLRKAHCMFGWDWGPRLPDAGIWQDITVIGAAGGMIDSVYITQTHSAGSVALSFRPEVRFCTAGTVLRAVVTAPDGTVRKIDALEDGIVIDNPCLWWPNGYGDQPLYTVRVECVTDGKIADSWERRIGLRTMTMHIEKDEWGESFAHEVNGVQIFAMGADYIPEDNILARVNPERTRKLLTDAVRANFNAVRIWGGGYYPSDFFYDICDELGLVVWQDFMFACAVYNLTGAFEQNIRAELTDNIRRLRHHASLGLWCGNNEMEMFVDQNLWVSSARQKADYIKIYEYIFPQLLAQHDPNTFYWPASPSSGGSFDSPNDFNRGDVHYWDVWHGNKPFSEYRKFHFRYASEFGFQSFPSLKTVESFTQPEDRNIFSYVMEKHQRNQSANGKILNYLSDTYRYPTAFPTLLYASQLLQAEAIKCGVEHWRRNRGRCMGAIYWQLNDCWPVASWASIDYYGRWKALHYYAKRFFAPVMISCCEEGIMTQNTNVNAEPFELKKTARLSVANETRSPVSGTVQWELRDTASAVLQKGEQAVTVAPLTSLWLDEMDFAGAALYETYLSYRFVSGGGVVSEGCVLFCPPKHFAFRDPGLTVTVNGNKLTVKAAAFAKSVEIDCADSDMILSDNYFDMNAGEYTVEIIEGKPGAIQVRSVFDIN